MSGVYEELFAEIDSCAYLFLRDISEPRENSLRLLVEEGVASPEAISVQVAGVAIEDCHRVESSQHTRLFEMLWDSYIAYSVRNESFTVGDDSEQRLSGKLIRAHSKSRFLDYAARATFASEEYPGPSQHIEVVCQLHVIDVISTNIPVVRRIRPS